MTADSEYKFLKALTSGEMQVRDRLQFELKSDFVTSPDSKQTRFVQEFYMFIPEALQINQQTYSRDEFYQDQTNFVRYKTPALPFHQLVDPNNSASPLVQVEKAIGEQGLAWSGSHFVAETKLLANICRSSLRDEVSELVHRLGTEGSEEQLVAITQRIKSLIDSMNQLNERLARLLDAAENSSSERSFHENLHYIQEFVIRSAEFYFTGLLKKLRDCEFCISQTSIDECDTALVELITALATHCAPANDTHEQRLAEDFHYRRSLLKKFMLDPLKIHISKRVVEKRYRHFIGAFAAGLAMLVYLVLFIWKSNYLAMNSTPFVLASVVLYILKDRLKEGVKLIWKQHAAQWFPDHVLEIRQPETGEILGELREFVTFLPPKSVPDDILHVRNNEFHSVLESFSRPETVLYARKDLAIGNSEILAHSRLNGLNTIFRLNLHKFIQKAAEPEQTYPILNLQTGEIESNVLPKVYHLNIIIRETVESDEKVSSDNIRKCRIILDKKGIKRIEDPRTSTGQAD